MSRCVEPSRTHTRARRPPGRPRQSLSARFPIELLAVGQIDARVARQGRLGEMHDPRAAVGRLLDLGQDLLQVQRNIRLDRELTTGNTKSRFHEASESAYASGADLHNRAMIVSYRETGLSIA